MDSWTKHCILRQGRESDVEAPPKEIAVLLFLILLCACA